MWPVPCLPPCWSPPCSEHCCKHNDTIEERDGGASNAYQSFLDIGKVFNYIARIFSGASSIINNVNVIYQSFVSLNSLLGSFGK